MYNSRTVGTQYEEEAVRYLQECGYKILDRNFRNRTGEIDIVAMDGRIIVFAEVKYRSNIHNGHPEDAVDYRKIKQICKVSLYYLKVKGYGTDVPVRYDVISIEGKEIKHIKDAFEFNI